MLWEITNNTLQVYHNIKEGVNFALKYFIILKETVVD